MKNVNLDSLDALLSGYWLSDLPNFAAYLYSTLTDINWVGFYLTDGKTLRLGPFMGKPACLEIPYSKGVCGKAFSLQMSLMIEDVHQFPGHISCDPASQSELVIPLYIDNKLVGVLDIDSPSIGRFKSEDKIHLEKAVAILSVKLSHYSGSKYGTI